MARLFDRSTRHHQSAMPTIEELRGHGSWARWHKAVLVQLDAMGLRHLLSADLRPLSAAAQHQYAADQRRAVEFLVRSTSEPVLRRLWAHGWTVREATLQNTLALLADLLAEPERHPQQSYETHRDIVDLARIDLAPGLSNKSVGQYLQDAQQCHLRLLARYGGGRVSVEELLEHLFTSSVMEGLKAARRFEYEGWMRGLEEERRVLFIAELAELVKGSQPGVVPALTTRGSREGERGTWERRRARRARKRSRAAWRLRPHVPYHTKYRGKEYPDRYRPSYMPPSHLRYHGDEYPDLHPPTWDVGVDEMGVEVESYDRSDTVDEIF